MALFKSDFEDYCNIFNFLVVHQQFTDSWAVDACCYNLVEATEKYEELSKVETCYIIPTSFVNEVIRAYKK